MDKCVRKTDHAFLAECFRRPYPTAAAHTRKRQKSCPSEPVFLQESDHPLCSVLIVCHNILDASAKSCLHSDLILFVHFDDISDNSEQAFLAVPVRHHFPYAVPVSVISFCYVLKRFQPGRFSVICSLPDPEFFLLLAKLFLQGFYLLLILTDLVIISPDRLLYFPELFFILVQPLRETF